MKPTNTLILNLLLLSTAFLFPRSAFAASAQTGLDRWTYIHADADRAPALNQKAGDFGIGFGDLNGDGYVDIASGHYFYRNPGGDMAQTPWPRITLPADPETGNVLDAGLLFSVTGQGSARDILAEDLPNIVWLHAKDPQGDAWTAKVVAHMSRVGHGNGRSIRLAHIIPANHRPDILLSGGGGTFLLQIPDHPEAGNWPIQQITTSVRDEQKGLGVGDVNGDGHLDLALAAGFASSQVDWWQNPGDGSRPWIHHTIGHTTNMAKMLEVADVNGDGRPDVVVTDSEGKDCHLFWFEAPADPIKGEWVRHEIAGGYGGLDSLSVADLNHDGQPDIVIGDTKGQHRLVIYENLNHGQSWKEHSIDEGKESHKGAQLVDLNGDGSLDIVSIAYFNYKDLHIWRNDNGGGLRATASPVAGETDAVTLSVGQAAHQTLEGFGSSLVDLSKTNIPERERAQMFDRVFGDLGMNVLRLWVGAGSGTTVESMKAQLYSRYADSGVIADAQKRGVTTLLLGPASHHVAPSQPMSQYAEKLADLILALRSERQIRISATGLNNEPGGFKPEQMAEGVRLLRADLDARGLQDVAIIAPESASADAAGMKQIMAMRADPAAWAALRGIATHSYNMAATPEFAATIAGTDKQYWMTEASDNGHEGPADANLASTIAARFLNDLNHGVTHWVYFIGFDVSSDVVADKDNATKLMVYDRKSNGIFTNLKYDWFRQLRAAFPNGSRIYPLQAQPGGELTYTYGQKPFLNAAAAIRPDGGWSLGAVNLTGAGPDTRIRKFHPATELAVTWDVPELTQAGPVTFAVFRSDAARRCVPDGKLTMNAGKLTLRLRPCELVTLQSESALETQGPKAAGSAMDLPLPVWKHLSSKTGDLPAPSAGKEQTASVVFDIDGDGVADVVIAERTQAPALSWLRHTRNGWDKYVIDDTKQHPEAGGTFYDVDGDGDLDLIIGGDDTSDELWWYENPAPNFEPKTPWKKHLIKKGGGKAHHDQAIADFKGNGKAQLMFWNQGARKLFMAEIPPEPRTAASWPITEILDTSTVTTAIKQEGMATFDVDGDGQVDLLAGLYWFKHTGGNTFKAIQIADHPGRIAAGHFRPGKVAQIVLAPGDGNGPLWFIECKGEPTDPKAWTRRRLLDRDVLSGHTLAVADINDDGNLDIFCAEMYTPGPKEKCTAWILYGDGQGNFKVTELSVGIGNHESRVADLNGDGKLDILTKPYTWDSPRVDVWLNQGNSR